MQTEVVSVVRHTTLEVEALLNEYDVFIRQQARRYMLTALWLVHPDALDLEIEELAQKIRIKIWSAWQKQEINNPKGYIGRIAHNEFISVMRQHRHISQLPLDEEGELYQGDVVGTISQEGQDPADEVEQADTCRYHLQKAVEAIVTLPQQQQQAMLYTLKTKVDDLRAFKRACRAYNIDVEALRPPTGGRELQAMRSSTTIARKNLRLLLLNLYTIASQSSRPIIGKEHQTMERKSAENEQNREIDEEIKETVNVAEIEAHIDKLQDPYRRAVVLHYLEKLSYPEIAAQLDLPVGTVKSHVSRGMKMLREYSKQHDIENQPAMSAKRYPTSVEETKIISFLDKLQEPYRRAVALHHLEKLSYPEIAAQLDLPVGTVKSHVSRGMKMLFGS